MQVLASMILSRDILITVKIFEKLSTNRRFPVDLNCTEDPKNLKIHELEARIKELEAIILLLF